MNFTKAKPRVLFFFADAVPTEDELAAIEALAGAHIFTRNAAAVMQTDKPEDADAVCGVVPEQYGDYPFVSTYEEAKAVMANNDPESDFKPQMPGTAKAKAKGKNKAKAVTSEPDGRTPGTSATTPAGTPATTAAPAVPGQADGSATPGNQAPAPAAPAKPAAPAGASVTPPTWGAPQS